MPDPIADRLRRAPNSTLPVGALWKLCLDGAARIDALEAELARIREADRRYAADLSDALNRSDGALRP